MSEMVERVARAIYDHERDPSYPEWDDDSDIATVFLPVARAAIAAMLPFLNDADSRKVIAALAGEP